MSQRQTLIHCAARTMFENNIAEDQVQFVVDDQARDSNPDMVKYYMNCSDKALRMLDKAVVKRLHYLQSFRR